MSYKLTFCIPVYNRAGYLGETLDSIIAQATDEIQIVISDNASTDNTREVVFEAQKKFKNIEYFCWDENQGADRNYLKTVELASGEYCWFLGSDDTIDKQAIKRILTEIQLACDIYLCSEYLCDLNMKPYAIHYLLDEKVDDRIFDFNNDSELYEYFTLAQSQSALFGYLSSIIFKREKWNRITYDETYTGTLYSHMFMLYSFIEHGCKIKYIKEPLVFWRSGNDSFGGAGKIQSRYLVDIDGFKKIMDDFFTGKEKILDAFKGVFRRHHPLRNIAYLRLNVKKKEDWLSIEQKLLNDYNYDKVQIKLLKCQCVRPILYLLFLGHRVLKRIRRTLFSVKKQ
ncbi:MAG: glycosyltransferase family 2 protein [Campylobacterales bacterium]|nr:glycosyltransferase family 2 protein [Campylobacterales bacterium]